MQQKKWHQQEQQVTGIQIAPTSLSVPILGSCVVGSMTVVLAPARSTSAAAMVMRTVTARLVPCFLALWTDEVSDPFHLTVEPFHLTVSDVVN